MNSSPLPLLVAVLLLLLSALSSCTKPPENEGDDGRPAARELSERDRAAFRIDLGDQLAGRTFDSAEDGPWSLRRAGGSTPSGRPGGAPAGRGATPDMELSVVESAPAPEGMKWEAGAVPPPAGAEPLAAGTDGADPGALAGGEIPEAVTYSREAAVADSFAASKGAEAVDREDVTLTPKSDSRPAAGVPLRAGSTDDNADFEAFLAYLEETTSRQQLAGRYDPIDVRGRRFIRVLDSAGQPVPSAEVLVVDERRDSIALLATTYGDGRVPFYPGAVQPTAVASPASASGAEGETAGEPVAATLTAGDAGVAPAAEPEYIVQVRVGDARQTSRWDGRGEEFVVRLASPRASLEPIRLDVCFLIDTTGSMSDEIARIKASLLSVTAKLRSLEMEFSLRYGAVLYRDLGDKYVTKSHPFTDDIVAFDEALKSVQAAGGGDGPESLNQGLAVAVGGLDWADGAARVVFLIADARPHMDYEGDVSYRESSRVALAKGIRVHCVAASGLDAAGTLVFRQISQFTRGKFIFIEYGDTATSAASHGVKGKVESNNLDDIIYEQIRDELAVWGRAM